MRRSTSACECPCMGVFASDLLQFYGRFAELLCTGRAECFAEKLTGSAAFLCSQLLDLFGQFGREADGEGSALGTFMKC